MHTRPAHFWPNVALLSMTAAQWIAFVVVLSHNVHWYVALIASLVLPRPVGVAGRPSVSLIVQNVVAVVIAFVFLPAGAATLALGIWIVGEIVHEMVQRRWSVCSCIHKQKGTDEFASPNESRCMIFQALKKQ